MKTQIIFIRHGQTDWNKNFIIQGRMNHPLNETGRNQARTLGKRMFEEGITDFDICISSPLDRAQETGRIILSEIKLDKELIIDPDCIEREFGEADEKEITKERYELIEKDEIEGIETKEQIKLRAYNFYQKLLNTYPGKKIIVFTHSHFIKSLVLCFNPSMTFSGCQINNCALNIITVEDTNVSVMCNK